MNNVSSFEEKRKKEAKKRVNNLLQVFKPKSKQEKQNELINKRIEMHQKSKEDL